MDERLERAEMTREETQMLLATIQAVYPNFKVERDRMTATINAWHLMLSEYQADVVNAALQIYVKTNTSGFAPSVSQLIGAMYEPKKQDTLSEGAAWSLVKKAIQDGNYHAEERFNELPELIQKTIGSPNMIREWAATDSEEVNTVIMSNFQRSYRIMLQRQEYEDKVPNTLSDLCKALVDNQQARLTDGTS